MPELRHTLRPDDPAAAVTTPEREGEGGGSLARAPAGDPIDCGSENFGLKRFDVIESALSQRLGVSRRWLGKLRDKNLAAGVDFVKTRGRRVLYCAAGIEKLAAFLSDGTGTNTMLPTAALREPPAVRDQFTFTVRRRVLNNRVLECADYAGRIVIVRVRDNTNFLAGMKVTAAPYGDQPNVYEFVGGYPRFRGKY